MCAYEGVSREVQLRKADHSGCSVFQVVKILVSRTKNKGDTGAKIVVEVGSQSLQGMRK